MPPSSKPTVYQVQTLNAHRNTGEIVHFVNGEVHIPGMIISQPLADGHAELLLFVPSFGIQLRPNVAYDETGKTSGTWHFKESI